MLHRWADIRGYSVFDNGRSLFDNVNRSVFTFYCTFWWKILDFPKPDRMYSNNNSVTNENRYVDTIEIIIFTSLQVFFFYYPRKQIVKKKQILKVVTKLHKSAIFIWNYNLILLNIIVITVHFWLFISTVFYFILPVWITQISDWNLRCVQKQIY